MSEKIAVRCDTKEEAYRVITSIRDFPSFDTWHGLKLLPVTIHPRGTNWGWNKLSSPTNENYKIITAEEYLKEGGNVSKFKLKDTVRGRTPGNDFQGAEGIIVKLDEHNNNRMTIEVTKSGKYKRAGMTTSNSLWGETLDVIKSIKEEVMSELISRVMADQKYKDVQLVIKHKDRIIGNMEDTFVNAQTLIVYGVDNLIKNAEHLEAEANKKD